MSIAAIETRYKGYRFRSRLEARWAVFFDKCGIRWEYEPEGFRTTEGILYLPDFKIYSGKDFWWVEVKGDPNWLRDNCLKITDTHEGEGILPRFAYSGANLDIRGGLIVLGNIPEPIGGDLLLPIIGHCQGVNLYWRRFVLRESGGIKFGFSFGQIHAPADHHNLPTYPKLESWGCPLCELTDTDVCSSFAPTIDWANMDEYGTNNVVIAALRAARSARFEHGETP